MDVGSATGGFFVFFSPSPFFISIWTGLALRAFFFFYPFSASFQLPFFFFLKPPRFLVTEVLFHLPSHHPSRVYTIHALLVVASAFGGTVSLRALRGRFGPCFSSWMLHPFKGDTGGGLWKGKGKSRKQVVTPLCIVVRGYPCAAWGPCYFS